MTDEGPLDSDPATSPMPPGLGNLRGAFPYNWFGAKSVSSAGSLVGADVSVPSPWPDEPLVRMCAWCGRVGRDNPDEIQWVSADELPPAPGRPITQGMCKDCENGLT